MKDVIKKRLQSQGFHVTLIEDAAKSRGWYSVYIPDRGHYETMLKQLLIDNPHDLQMQGYGISGGYPIKGGRFLNFVAALPETD